MQETGPFVLVALIAAALAVGGAWYTTSAYAACATLAKRLEAALAEILLLETRIDTLQTAVRRIEGRQVKALQRARGGPEDEPDPKTDPEGWKQFQNRKLASRSRLQ